MEQRKGYSSRIILILLGTIAGVALDQYTKWLAVKHLKGQEAYVLIKDVFCLQYLENKGAAFGLMQNQRAFFFVGTALMVAMVLFCFIKMPKTKRFLPLFITGTCLLTGALGNFIDRLRLGYVVDFFYFELINFPVFNVADIFVTLSFIALLYLILFHYKEDEFNWAQIRRSKPKINEE